MNSQRDGRAMLVECTDCGFRREVTLDEEPLPADVLNEHADETGHTLSLSGPDAG